MTICIYKAMYIYIYTLFLYLHIIITIFYYIPDLKSQNWRNLRPAVAIAAACNVRARPLVRWHVRCKGSLARHPSQGPNSPNAS